MRTLKTETRVTHDLLMHSPTLEISRYVKAQMARALADQLIDVMTIEECQEYHTMCKVITAKLDLLDKEDLRKLADYDNLKQLLKGMMGGK